MSETSATIADLTSPPSAGRQRRLPRPSYVTSVAIVTFLVLLGAWWLAARLELVSAIFLPSPQAVLAKFFAVWREGFEGATLPQHLLASVGRVLVALVFASITGALLGFGINLNETARGIFEPIIEFYRPIPPLAYLPLVIIWCGIGEFAKILVIYLGILPSIVIATSDGLRSVTKDRTNAALSLGASRSQVIYLVLLPHALPSILTGVRIGLGTGWATLVAAELIAATQGLGFMIKGAADFLVTDVVVLGIIVIAVVSIGMELLLRLLQRVAVPWQGHE